MKFLKINDWVKLVVLLVFFSACEREDDKPSESYTNGVFITCEGPFQTGSGSVDFYNRTIGGIKNDIFAKENNGAAVGNILQSLSIKNDTAYLVVNNANKLVTVTYKNFKQLSTIEGFSLPRFFMPIDDIRAYVSEWGTGGLAGGIKVYDYSTKKVAKTISTGKGTGKMIRIGTRVWAVNEGGLGKDSTLVAVDIFTDSVVNKITVGLGPNSLVADANFDIWVLSGGYFDRSDKGKLMKIRNDKVEVSFDVPKFAHSLIRDDSGNTLYFIADGKIYRKDIVNFGNIPPSVFMSQSYFQYPYSLGFDPKSGYLYCGDAKTFTNNGTVYIFDPNSKVLKDSIKTGIAPNNFYFN